jgi:hypothetical protein
MPRLTRGGRCSRCGVAARESMRTVRFGAQSGMMHRKGATRRPECARPPTLTGALTSPDYGLLLPPGGGGGGGVRDGNKAHTGR